MTAAEATEAIETTKFIPEAARWRSKGGAVGVWLDDGSVRMRLHAVGNYKTIGDARFRRDALNLLRRYRRHWWPVASLGRDRALRTINRDEAKALPRPVTDGKIRAADVECNGVLLSLETKATEELKLGRIALYTLRAARHACFFSAAARSIFDGPLDLETIRYAILHPEAGLTDTERRAALVALLDECAATEILGVEQHGDGDNGKWDGGQSAANGFEDDGDCDDFAGDHSGELD